MYVKRWFIYLSITDNCSPMMNMNNYESVLLNKMKSFYLSLLVDYQLFHWKNSIQSAVQDPIQ